jgi:hypothetical protein
MDRLGAEQPMEHEDALVRFYPEVMPEAQQGALRAAGPFTTELGFYLAGGTALAIQVGHRRSVDLDWFTPNRIMDPLRLASDLRYPIPGFEVTGTEAGTLHGVADGVKFSFLEYPYPAVAESVAWQEYSCRLASLEDIACMKLSAIGGRGAKKDFIDIYALGRTRFSLADMLSLYQRKFSIADVGHVVMSLAYFDDAEAEETPEMLWEVGWSEIREEIEGWVKGLVKRPTRKNPRRGGPA